jgi:hypothetical protein
MLQVFQLFRTYIVSVSSGCYKTRSGVVHVALGPSCCNCLLQLLGRRRSRVHAHGKRRGHERSRVRAGGTDLAWAREMEQAREMGCRHRRLSGHPSASNPLSE